MTFWPFDLLLGGQIRYLEVGRETCSFTPFSLKLILYHNNMAYFQLICHYDSLFTFESAGRFRNMARDTYFYIFLYGNCSHLKNIAIWCQIKWFLPFDLTFWLFDLLPFCTFALLPIYLFIFLPFYLFTFLTFYLLLGGQIRYLEVGRETRFFPPFAIKLALYRSDMAYFHLSCHYESLFTLESGVRSRNMARDTYFYIFLYANCS